MTKKGPTIYRPNFTGYQDDILYDPARFTVTEACTKSGKTFSHLYWLFEIALGGNPLWYTNAVESGWNFWWVAPVYSQSEIAFNRMVRKIKNAPGYKINYSKLRIQTPKETFIEFKTAKDPNNLYGEDVYAAVFDEFTRSKEDAWHALRTTLTSTKGPCKFIGNYIGSLNWGHKLGKKALIDKNYSYHKVNATQAVEAGIIDPDEIEQARKDLPKSIYEALYMVMGALDDSILFTEESISDLFTNDYVKPIHRRYMTADIALHGSDRFVIGIWHGFRLVKIYCYDKMEADEVERKLKGLAAEHSIPRSRIIYDADGLGTYLRGYLKGAKPFVNGSRAMNDENYQNLKTQCFYKLSKFMEDGLLYIEDHNYKEDIEKELEVIRKDGVDEEGKLKIIKKKEIKQLLGYSPDFADMIMMRMLFELKSSLPPML